MTTTKILVVDDSQLERVLVEGILCKNPEYRVELAANGREALEKIAAGAPDLVVTDLMMPELDGLELVRTARRRYPDIPVILMSSKKAPDDIIKAYDAGIDGYVTKPFNKTDLQARISKTIG